MQSPRAKALLGVAALAVILVAAAGPLGALPALLAFAVLFAGHYPGADQLDRWIASASRDDAPRRPSSSAAPRRPIFVLVGRGGFLIAASLAKRPPPSLLSHA
jgi:hypothetical protein